MLSPFLSGFGHRPSTCLLFTNVLFNGLSQSLIRSLCYGQKYLLVRRRELLASTKTPPLEKRVVEAVRCGDVQKALQQFFSPPIAPKTQQTFEALKALHPPASKPVSPPTTEPGAAPAFEPKLIREALATFPACSAAGLFGYRPSLLRQCADAESYFFMLTLGSFVNKLAAGEAPRLLQPFLAGGVSIALQKPNRTIRPLFGGQVFLYGW